MSCRAIRSARSSSANCETNCGNKEEAPSSTSGSGSSSVLPLTNFGSVGFTGVTVNGKSMDTLSPVQITMPDTSVGDMASDGSFSVNYTGTGFAQWFGV
jgi:hypothetical protein